MATEKLGIYSRVTEQIITAVESNPGSWTMPWHNTGSSALSPINFQSRKAYRGINTLALWSSARANGYSSGEWGTYNQWAEKKAQVRKGEKFTLVVFWKFANTERETEDGDTVYGSKLVCARGYSVFNANQVDGYTSRVEEPVTRLERIALADAFFRGLAIDLRHGGNQAYYSSLTDHVQMPEFDQFRDNASYYSTLAHESTHWTSNTSRCNRQLGKRFGDMAYAAEELIAELGAAFVMAKLGLSSEPREDHAQYISSWLKVLKQDKRAIFTAASKAQQACDWLLNRSPLPETESQDIARDESLELVA